jgi:hypothetical protein
VKQLMRDRAHLGRSCLIMASGGLLGLNCLAQRAAVLGQIDLPHPKPAPRVRRYGTGGFRRTAASLDADSDPATAPAQEIHYEETTWKARPDVSPDGSRLVYSSYLGGSWHNLWLLPASGGDAFPLTYGDWDQTNPRWSPDGGRIAFISNRLGTTTIDIVTIPGGEIRSMATTTRLYLQPQTTLRLALHDAAGRPASAGVSVTDAAGVFYAPTNAWIHADDGFDRKERRFEAHYFHPRGEVKLACRRARSKVRWISSRPLLLATAAFYRFPCSKCWHMCPRVVPQRSGWVRERYCVFGARLQSTACLCILNAY